MFLSLGARLAAALALGLGLHAQCWAQTPGGVTGFKEVQIGPDTFTIGNPVPAWVDAIPIPDPDKSEPVVVRLADTQFWVGTSPTFYSRRAIMTNDAASLSAAGQVAIVFVPEYHRVQLHTIQILRGAEVLDRTTSSGVRFLQRERGLEQGIYSGQVTASILVDDLRVGDTLVVAYSVTGQNPVFAGKFVDAASWDQSYKTALRRVTLNYPTERNIAWRLIGSPKAKAITPTETMQNGMRKLLFEERTLPRIDQESYTPPDYHNLRWLQFSEFASWQEVADWANPLFQARDTSSEEFRTLVERLRGAPTTEEQAVRALEFVQSEIRYFSVSMGESSHRPTQPDLVLTRRYGDCKDKTLLLMSLLKALGVPSKAVLLQAQQRDGLDALLPAPNLFDHVIARVALNGAVYYLDPTVLGQHGRLNRMGQYHEGARTLLVSPETRGLETIVSPNNRDLVRNEVAETAALPVFGKDARMQRRTVYHGRLAEMLRVSHQRLPRDQIVKFYASALQSRYPGTVMIGEPEIQDDLANNVLTVNTTYTVPNLASEHEGNWFIRVVPSNMKGVLIVPPSPTREAPLFFPAFPFDATYSLEVTLPEEVRVASDPHTDTVQGKSFDYTFSSAFRGNIAKGTVHLRLLADRVEAPQLAKYSQDVQALNKKITAIIIPRSAIRGGPAKTQPKDFDQVIVDRLQTTIAKTTDAIKSGKLSRNDLAESYCMRSGAQSNLGKVTEALADAEVAIKSGDDERDYLHCRAEVYFGSGQLEKSIADYSRAIALGSPTAYHYRQRGISRFFAGKFDEVIDDMSKAADDGETEGRVYADLWAALAYGRLGRPVSEAVLARASLQPRGDWPRPALALAAGILTPEEMLKLVERKKGDDLRMALSEAYFYLGEYFLGHGDAAKARDFFQKARQQKVTIYIEHKGAGFELQHLGAPTETGTLPKGAEQGPKKAKPKAPAKSWMNGILGN